MKNRLGAGWNGTRRGVCNDMRRGPEVGGGVVYGMEKDLCVDGLGGFFGWWWDDDSCVGPAGVTDGAPDWSQPTNPPSKNVEFEKKDRENLLSFPRQRF